MSIRTILAEEGLHVNAGEKSFGVQFSGRGEDYKERVVSKHETEDEAKKAMAVLKSKLTSSDKAHGAAYKVVKLKEAAKPPSVWDVQGTKDALNQIPGVEVKYVLKDPFGSVPHFRVIVPNFKTAIMVYPSPGYQKVIEVASSKTIKGVPPTMSIKDSVATPQAVKERVEKWIAAYVKMNGAAAPAKKEPSVQRVLENVYYGRPLPK